MRIDRMRPLRLLAALLVAARRVRGDARRRRSPPTGSRAGRSTRTARTTATCSAASGCFGATTRASARSSISSASRRPTGWSAVTIPNAWNVGDDSVASMTGTTAWYRKDFTVPGRARAAWTGSCASSPSTIARRCGSTASPSAATRAPTCPGTCAFRAARSSAGEPTGSWCASTTAACRPTSRPPG